jgi:hypothetical protein
MHPTHFILLPAAMSPPKFRQQPWPEVNAWRLRLHKELDAALAAQQTRCCSPPIGRHLYGFSSSDSDYDRRESTDLSNHWWPLVVNSPLRPNPELKNIRI